MFHQASHETGFNTASTASASLSRPLQLLGAFMLGALIIYGTGFANIGAVHNAAHDTRHSQGFPCH